MDQERLVADAVAALLREHPPATTDVELFFGAQFDAGLAKVDLPAGLGGLGVDASWQRTVDEQLRAAGAKSPVLRNPVAVGMGLPTLLKHGTPEQVARHYRPAFTAAEMWCQLFSEPGSGSDLAGLSTRAVREGDGWRVNGQKVWTSLGHLARLGMLLARTDPDAPKHLGITFFLIEMDQPGVEVRPLRQLTGDAEFNEVFLTDAWVPDSARVGDVNDGWTIARTTLSNERVALSGAGGGISRIGGSRVDALIARAKQGGAWEDPAIRDDLVRRYVEGEVIRFSNLRARRARAAGQPEPEGSMMKLAQALYNRRLQRTAMRALGEAGTAWDPDDPQGSDAAHGLLRAQANTIEGGTSNVLRNVVGERVLGLPREPGPPAATPWSQLPRNG
jgi:alkylation response protein AidB-like acyl-CoA dehydrogenase